MTAAFILFHRVNNNSLLLVVWFPLLNSLPTYNDANERYLIQTLTETQANSDSSSLEMASFVAKFADISAIQYRKIKELVMGVKYPIVQLQNVDSKYGNAAVSYTHLDVYKRQVHL